MAPAGKDPGRSLFHAYPNRRGVTTLRDRERNIGSGRNVMERYLGLDLINAHLLGHELRRQDKDAGSAYRDGGKSGRDRRRRRGSRIPCVDRWRGRAHTGEIDSEFGIQMNGCRIGDCLTIHVPDDHGNARIPKYGRRVGLRREGERRSRSPRAGENHTRAGSHIERQLSCDLARRDHEERQRFRIHIETNITQRRGNGGVIIRLGGRAEILPGDRDQSSRCDSGSLVSGIGNRRDRGNTGRSVEVPRQNYHAGCGDLHDGLPVSQRSQSSGKRENGLADLTNGGRRQSQGQGG